MPEDEFEGFFERDQVLGGSPAKRAASLIFLIEARTAKLVAQTRRTVQRFVTEDGERDRAMDYVEAFALARDLPAAPRIQDLERYAPEWADLVPENPQLRAALAHRLGEKYRFDEGRTRGIGAALGTGSARVREAYERLYGAPLESIYTSGLGALERLRWTWSRLAARLESMPPFWMAYSLTLTETVGVSILALPIAVASIGAVAGIVILIALGIVNVLTISFLSEAIVRCGPMRYGAAFLGRLVSDLLGRPGALVLSAVLFLFCALSLPVFFVGFGTTLEEATNVDATIWIALLFFVGLVFLRKESIDATVATALVVGAVNMSLILAIAALTLTHMHTANLTNVEFSLAGDPFDASLAGVLFGVALFAYFGHTAVAMCGSLVLRRDPSGTALIRGATAAMATAIGLYCLFVLAVNGAVPAQELTHQAGTALVPLEEELGPIVSVLGSMFAVLAIGMGALFLILDLFELTRERVPALGPRVVALPRRRACLVFGERASRLGLTYLGRDPAGFRFRVDREVSGVVDERTVVVSGHWNVLDDELEQHLLVETLDGDDRHVRLVVSTSLPMSYEGDIDRAATSLLDILEAPDDEAGLVGFLMRAGPASLEEIAAGLGTSEEHAGEMIGLLVARGAASERDGSTGPVYEARLARRRARGDGDLWSALRDDVSGPPVSVRSTRLSEPAWRLVLFGRSGRFVLPVLPIVAAFLVGEWMVVTGSASFTGLLAFTGVVALSLLIGLYPVLLLVASRRKGMHTPARVFGFLANPILLGGIYAVFLASLVIHGIVIWQGPLQRAGALAAALAMLILPAALARRGSLARRLTIEVCEDQRDGTTRFAIASSVGPAEARVQLDYEAGERDVRGASGRIPDFAALRRLVFRPLAMGAPSPSELKVWAHRVSLEGHSEPMPARVRLEDPSAAREADVTLSRGEAIFALTAAEYEVTVAPRGADR